MCPSHWAGDTGAQGQQAGFVQGYPGRVKMGIRISGLFHADVSLPYHVVSKSDCSHTPLFVFCIIYLQYYFTSRVKE